MTKPLIGLISVSDRRRLMTGVLAALAGLAAGALLAQSGNGPALATLANLSPQSQSRMVSPENPTGEPGKGAMAIPAPSDPNLPFSGPAVRLGQGWKVNPFVKIAPHATLTIMDVAGPGTIEHIWMAAGDSFTGNGRAIVLRFYWDDETTPSVEVPMTDFFAIGNDRFAPVNSAVVVDNPPAAMNCYWPCPSASTRASR